jgi:para-aminobenzoate synthetase component 1
MNEKLNPLFLLEKCHPRWSKQQYIQAFDQVQEYIKAGDCYQINLTQEFIATAQGSLLDQAQDLWELTHAPYAGYLKIDDFELLSCSPELFIEFQANRKIKTRPIKGTMPRFEDDKQDQISRNKLSQSEKDQAENVMIVDLLRNDLSVYAEIGSVETTKLFEIESFNQVHHMVSEITAILKEDVNPIEMLLSALPGGSITGAPKIRAMQIIEELEGAPRGAYCGSLGYFNFDGTGRWNILIRSIQKYQDQLSLWAGGGITIASNAEAEYQECFDKISAMLDLINTWQMSEN